MKLEKEAMGLIVGALILGALGGYFVGGSQGGGLQAQVASLTSQVNSLQTQVTSLQTQVTTLQSDKTTLQGQITTLQGDKTALQTQVNSLTSNNTALQAEITRLTALIPPQPPTEGELGSSRFFPAPIGMAIPVIFTYSGGQYSAKITVKQIIRGDTAWGMIYDANMFNDPPPTGYEYILVKVRFELTSAPTVETSFQVYSYSQFKAVSGAGRIYDNPLVVEPDPQLDTTLYQGAYNEGWCAFLIEKTDANPMMVFARRADGTGGIWLKLYP